MRTGHGRREINRTDKWRVVVRNLFYSFKSRAFLVIFLSTLIPLVLIGGISYYSIISILDNKLQGSIRANLQQVKAHMENIVDDLNYVSLQLAFDNRTGARLEDRYEAFLNEIEIKRNMNLISFANPSVGLTFYYYEGVNKPVFQDESLVLEFDPDKLPVLMDLYGTVYYGPHTSMNRFFRSTVFSITRRLEVPGFDNLNVYVETNNQEPFLDKTGLDISYLIVDIRNRISYSDLQEQFPVGSAFPVAEPLQGVERLHGNYVFEEVSQQKWRLIAMVPQQSYNKERNIWLLQYMALAVVSLAIAFFGVGVVWGTVYKPLSRFRKEIKMLENNNFDSAVRYTHIYEFDDVLTRFQQMKEQVGLLLLEVANKEKRKTQLEIEKLLFQINPHFIHNTLDTLRWMARSKGDKEMDQAISALNRLLYYNMGKSGKSTIGQEVDALQDYIALQRIRYDFEFKAVIQAEDHLLDKEIPRFLLQPLVENSLYHGLREDGVIEVNIHMDRHGNIRFRVSDNGVGIGEEKIKELMEGSETDEQRKVGMGIGLYYVKRMLQSQFGERASLDIQSRCGAGTVMIITIPVGGDDIIA